MYSSLSALQQAVASSQAGIANLQSAGLAELASSHVLKQAEVTAKPREQSTRMPHRTMLALDVCPDRAAISALCSVRHTARLLSDRMQESMRYKHIPAFWSAFEKAPSSGAGLEHTLLASLKVRLARC